MKVLYIHRDDSVHDRRFIDALGNLAVEVVALQLENRGNDKGSWKPPDNVNLVSWSRYDRPFRWSYGDLFTKELQKLVQSMHPDVIHAGPVDLCGYLAAKSGFSPLVAMSWGYDLLVNAESNFINRSRVRFTLNRTTVLLADCKAVSDQAHRFGFPFKRIVTFPWGVDLRVFRPGTGERLRTEFGWDKKTILLSTRSMEKLYGCDVLVDAFIKAAQSNEHLCLLMLGDGSQKEQLMDKIASAGLNERVKFTGFVPETDITQYFQASDVYISASHSDGSSVSLLQAMACRIPPLVSNIPGNREWVTPGQNGWLFDDGDRAGLSALMSVAASSPQLRKKYGKASREIVQKKADWEKNSRKLGDAYQQAIKVHLEQVKNSC